MHRAFALVPCVACAAASLLSAQAPGVHPNPAYIVAAVPPAFTIAMTARPSSAWAERGAGRGSSPIRCRWR